MTGEGIWPIKTKCWFVGGSDLNGTLHVIDTDKEFVSSVFKIRKNRRIYEIFKIRKIRKNSFYHITIVTAKFSNSHNTNYSSDSS